MIPGVVYALLAANIWAFVAEWRAADPAAAIDAFAAIPWNLTHGLVLAAPSPPIPALTLVTSMFVHGSLSHIAFNMLFLVAFGPDVEALCGHVRFAAFYLICGLAGGLLQVAVGPDSHVPAIGASGAIAGVLGAYVVSFPLRLGAVLFIVVWAGAQFLSGYGSLVANGAAPMGGTAYFAHIGGFACGVLAIAAFRHGDAGTRAQRWY